MGERLTRTALDKGSIEEIVGVWDPSEAAMARLADGFALKDADAVIEAADCVYVATPPSSHIDYARRTLQAGKALFLEKPLSHDMEGSRAFVADVEAADHRAAVNYILASSPAVDQLKTWAKDGLVGDTIERITLDVAFAEWPRPWQMAAVDWLGKRAEGGFTREVVSHFLFLARRLAGPLELQKAQVLYPEEGGERDQYRRSHRMRGRPDPPDRARWGDQYGRREHVPDCGDGGAIRLRDWSIAELRLFDGTWGEAPNALPHAEMRPVLLKGQLEKLAAMTRGEPHTLATVREALEVQELSRPFWRVVAAEDSVFGGPLPTVQTM